MRLIDADALDVVGTVIPSDIDTKSYVMGMEYILNKIDSLPTIEERKTGHYIGESDGYADGELVYDIWSCSECGCYFEDWDEQPTYNFCPDCGADMRKENRWR